VNTFDVNVLVAASRSDHPSHGAALDWLKDALAQAQSGGSLVLFSMVALGFLRVATHPRVFASPTPIGSAWDFLDAVRQAPGVNLIEGETPWVELKELSIDRAFAGNDLPDAWLASKVRNEHLKLATFDKGFKKMLRPSMLNLLV
jgi:uncharacterized protein